MPEWICLRKCEHEWYYEMEQVGRRELSDPEMKTISEKYRQVWSITSVKESWSFPAATRFCAFWRQRRFWWWFFFLLRPKKHEQTCLDFYNMILASWEPWIIRVGRDLRRSRIQAPVQSRISCLWHFPGNIAGNRILKVVVIIQWLWWTSAWECQSVLWKLFSHTCH